MTPLLRWGKGLLKLELLGPAGSDDDTPFGLLANADGRHLGIGFQGQVDAGIGAPSDAALAMELGAAACLVNTAVAQAKESVQMAHAMRLGVEAGRTAYLAGRIPRQPAATASSPTVGLPSVGR